MRRSPRRGEITGGRYTPEGNTDKVDNTLPTAGSHATAARPKGTYEVRSFEGSGTFNEQVDACYAEHGGGISLEALGDQVRKRYESRLGRLAASMERLREKQRVYENGNTLKELASLLSEEPP